MPGYQDLKNAKPATLIALASAWIGIAETHTEASKMLASHVTDKLTARSLDGQAIRAAQGRGDELNEQIKAGVSEADAIAGLVEGFGAGVAALQIELLNLAAQVKAQEPHMKLNEASGTVSYTPPPMDSGYESHPEIYAEITADGAEAARRFTESIGDVLSRARTLDATFAKNLTTVTELDAPFDSSFNPDSDQDIADVKAREDAGKVADLLHGGEDRKVSVEELGLANQLMARHKDDDAFATTLMDDLGPKGLLSTSADIAQRFGTDGDPGNDRLALAMRERLGLTLATATDSGNEFHVDENWMSDLRDEGASTYKVGNGEDERVTPGYTLLAPLLTEGKFDGEFITPVAQHMLALDKHGINWSSEPDPLAPYDKSSVNPVNGALIALDHNPEAATEVFSGRKPEHQFPGYPYAPPNVTDTVEPVDDPLEYVLDTAGKYAAIDTDVAGNALEAAATGMPSGTDLSKVGSTPVHTEDMAKVTSGLFDYVSEHDGDFKGTERLSGMVDNLGDVTSNYIEDFYSAYTPNDSWNPASYGVAPDLPSDPGGFDDSKMDRWMQLMGTDDHAAEAVAKSSGQVTELAMSNGATDADTGSRQANLYEAMHGYGRISGEVMQGRIAAYEDGYLDSVKIETGGVEGGKWLAGRLLGEVPVIGNELGTASGYLIDGAYDFREKDIQDHIHDEQQRMSDKERTELEEKLRPLVEQSLAVADVNDKTEADQMLKQFAHFYYGAIK